MGSETIVSQASVSGHLTITVHPLIILRRGVRLLINADSSRLVTRIHKTVFHRESLSLKHRTAPAAVTDTRHI